MPERTGRPRPVVAAVVTLCALLASGCAGPANDGSGLAFGAGREQPGTGVRAALGRLVGEGGAPGAAALGRESDGSWWYGAAGTAKLDGVRGAGTDGERRIALQDRFRAGSVTKTFVATVVLQLAAEGRLALSDTVDDHLPGLVRGNGNDGRRITLRQLLGHTSGLFDYTRDPRLREESFGSGFTGHRYDSRTPSELVRAALRHAPYAAPGTAYHYSNTDYILLGAIVERVSGRPYADEIELRLLRPLRMTGTSMPGTTAALPRPHGRAYSTVLTVPGTRRPMDVTTLDPSAAGAAGEAVSTLGDLNRFLSALLGGELLPEKWLRLMRDTSRTDGVYGAGLFPVRLSCGVTLWGHNGIISGSYVQVLGTVGGRHLLSYRVNTDEIDGRAETALLRAEFC